MSRRTPGLLRRGNSSIWTIDKCIKGYGRLYESTGTSDLEEAERYLNHRLSQIREELKYGKRQQRTFRFAATKYLREFAHKRSIDRDAQALKNVDPFIGDKLLHTVHQDTLAEFVEYRRERGVKSSTVNRDLAVVRRILNLSARLWRDDQGRSWLSTAPLIQLLDWSDARKPYPLNWNEQARLFGELPNHLGEMALFKVNTGTREQEVCSLMWEWEVVIPELSTSVFVIPEEIVKNGEDRLIVLNSVASAVIGRQRGKHDDFVFTYKGHPVDRINTKAWRRARSVAKLEQVRVHDLKHTFGRRLRAAEVPHETRQVLLGHKNNQITTHYSSAEIDELIEAVERVSWDRGTTPAVTLIQKPTSRKIHALGRGNKNLVTVSP